MIDGNMLNKLKFIYVLYDTNQKGYLDSSGYHKFLNNIVNTAVIYNNGGYQAFFNDDCDRFFHTFKNHEKLKNPEKVKFSEIGEALSKSPFILTHCREKKKKMSIIKSKSTITGGDNPFNLNPPNLHDDTALPDPVVNFETNTGSVVIEEQKEEQDVSDKSSSVSSEEKNDDVPIDEDPATPEKEETPQEIAQIDSNSSEKNSDEKQNLIFVEHLSAKTAISAWASREKAAQEQQRARTSVTQRPSIQKSRTSIVDQPTLYDNPMKPLSQDQPDDKPILNFPYKENINAHLQTSNTPTLKTHKSHDFSLPTNVDLSLSAPHDKVNTSIAYVIPIHYNCIEPHPTDENYQTSIFYDHEQLFANTSTAPPVHTQDSLSNPASTSSRADYVTPSPKDQNVEVSFLESFAFKRDSSVTPQGPVEKSATVAKTEKPVVVAENNFLNEDALRGRGPMSDEEKQVQKKRAQDAAKEAQGANCKVCNIF